MINTFAQVDQCACAGRTVWHRASATSKLVLATALVLVAVFAPSRALLGALLLTTLVLLATARLPWRLVLAAASAPLFFSLVFVIARWQGDWGAALAVALRPVVASFAALWLVGTTPYPDLFSPLSRVLPRVIGDSLFLTYRSVFVLLARIERLQRTLALRGGLAGPLRQRAGMMGEAVGTVVLSGFERSQRLYQTMLLRGHSGRICGCRHFLEFTAADLAVLAGLVWTATAAVCLWGFAA